MKSDSNSIEFPVVVAGVGQCLKVSYEIYDATLIGMRIVRIILNSYSNMSTDIGMGWLTHL